MKFSARPVKNLVNLCAKIRSISSACLILILIRIALIDGSIRTCSFSFLAICIEFKMISEDVLEVSVRPVFRLKVLCFDFGDVVSFHDLA